MLGEAGEQFADFLLAVAAWSPRFRNDVSLPACLSCPSAICAEAAYGGFYASCGPSAHRA
jgi:hypothetical protein